MKTLLPLLALMGLLSLTHAGSCPEACRDACGTEKSCCPARGGKCSSVQLERGGTSGSAYSTKSGLRLR